ncbi:hypothetical protein HB364_14025 [Pseudoflavitalea sp. X16]|uniref:hypothetical protein n=1 Tax=Paraflavitalea devenefica TaxID=2716334 RepID=UPI00141FDCE5|nr:hypothetical protein [Paraflavitalea devenefica]NII26207.1 hypothetical protein [Paraflavitalea devenefica]
MDNHITIFPDEKNSHGPLDYMPYRLVTTAFSRLRRLPSTEESIAYFSLKQAFFTLLLTDLKSIGPRLERSITDHTGAQLYGRLFRESPYGPQPEGIYLETGMSPEAFCSLCGLFYSAEDHPGSSKALLLATFKQDGNEISPTLICEALWTRASAFMDEISRIMGEFPLQTSFQGFIHELEMAKIGEKAQSRFIEQHFFNHPAEGLFILLNKDPRFFDTFSEVKKYSYQHEFGFLLDVSKDHLAEIKVIPIQPSTAADPTAGIYLFCPAGIASLEQQTSMDLSKFADYDPGSQYLCLAHYKYDRGFSIRLDPIIQKLVIWEDANDQLIGIQPASPFVVSTHYQYHPMQSGHQHYATASDHYHCNTYEQALLKLLGTDFSLFETHQQVLGPFSITSAKIEGSNFLQRTWLETETVTPPGQKGSLYPTQINLIFDAKAPMNEQMAMVLPQLEGFGEFNQAGRHIRKIIIARPDKMGLMEPVAANMNVLLRLLAADLALDGNESVAKVTLNATPTDLNRCRLELRWHHHAENATSPEHITIPDLDTALNMLLELTPKQFTPAAQQQGQQWLKGASIVDLEEGRVLAHLFCEFQGTASLGPGMYLNIFTDSKDLIALVAARTELQPRGSLGSEYLQYTNTRFSITNPVQHPRIIGPDPNSDQIHNRL